MDRREEPGPQHWQLRPWLGQCSGSATQTWRLWERPCSPGWQGHWFMKPSCRILWWSIKSVVTFLYYRIFKAFTPFFSSPPQVNSLGETAERLIQSHPEAVDDIQEKCTELNTAWSSLVGRADQRKDKLGNSHDLQRFLSDFRWNAFSVKKFDF